MKHAVSSPFVAYLHPMTSISTLTKAIIAMAWCSIFSSRMILPAMEDAHAEATLQTLLDTCRSRKEADSSDIAIAQKCLDAHIDPNTIDCPIMGLSLLHIATRAHNCKIAALLIERNADIHARDQGDYTPLHGAAISIYYESFDPSDWTIERFPAKRPSQDASDAQIQTVSLLLDSKADIEEKNEHGSTCLHLATDRRNYALAEFLIQKKAHVDAQHKYDGTCLHIAARSGYIEIIKLLLTHKADVNTFDIDFRTPLHMAIKYNYKDIVRLLLDNNADVTWGDGYPQHEPLMHLALHMINGIDILNTLIDRKANIEARDSEVNNTPLHTAVRYSDPQVVRLLLHNKAQTDIPDSDGRTPLDVATQAERFEIIEMLQAHSASAQEHSADA